MSSTPISQPVGAIAKIGRSALSTNGRAASSLCQTTLRDGNGPQSAPAGSRLLRLPTIEFRCWLTS
jgi:hypothetical protein